MPIRPQRAGRSRRCTSAAGAPRRDDARRAPTLRLSDGACIGMETSSSATSRQRRETPWRSLPTTTAIGPSRRASQQRARPRAWRQRRAHRSLAARESPLRRRTRRPGGGRACRPSRERDPDGRRRCVRRRRPARSRRTSRRSGRARPGSPAARFLRRREAAGRRPARPIGASSANVGAARDEGSSCHGSCPVDRDAEQDEPWGGPRLVESARATATVERRSGGARAACATWTRARSLRGRSARQCG